MLDNLINRSKKTAIKAADITFARGADHVSAIIQGLPDQSFFRKGLEEELNRSAVSLFGKMT
jgi:hypothetical protein